MNAPTTNHSRAALVETRQRLESMARDAQGRFMATERMAELNRYFADRAYREEVDARRDKMTVRNNLLMTAGQVKYLTKRFNGREEPWFLPIQREQIITYARAERDYQLLITAGLSHEEACEIVNAKPECNA